MSRCDLNEEAGLSRGDLNEAEWRVLKGLLPIDATNRGRGLLWLSKAQMRRIEPYFPLSHGIPRVDDRRVISGITFVIRNGLLPRCDARV